MFNRAGLDVRWRRAFLYVDLEEALSNIVYHRAYVERGSTNQGREI